MTRDVHTTHEMFGLAAALFAATESNLIASLLAGARTAAEHARPLGLDPRATERVLDVLVAFELARRTGDAYGASPELVAHAESSPGGLAMALELWAHTGRFLRSGEPYVRMDAERELTYAHVVAKLGHLMNAAAEQLAGKLVRAPRRVLDIGCGSGVWSLAIARRFPAAHVTGLDLPAVLAAFPARAGEVGVAASRIATLAGDVHTVAIPQAFDLIVIANVLRIEAPDRARGIVQRAAAALVPGGELLVVDALASGSPERERSRSVYALHLAMRTEHGRVYAPDEIAAWMTEAALVDVAPIHLDPPVSPGALGALLGRR